MSSKRTFNDIKDFDDEDNLDDEYGQKENKYEHSINATLFLIDARKKMFSSHFDKETSAILACLKVVVSLLNKKNC